MEDFEIIPEIQQFRQYFKGKKTLNAQVARLKNYWKWIREDPVLSRISRPALWDIRHVKAILDRLKEKQVSLYQPKQVFRRFFESQENYKMQKHKLIKAHRKDMRSPKGARRKETEFPPSLLPKIWEPLTPKEKDNVNIHLTVKSREGEQGKSSLLNIQWKDINWKDKFYGLPMATVDVYETKTGGGTWWRHCPLDLWFSDLSKRLKDRWEKLGRPKEGYVCDMTYKEYLDLWHRIGEKVGIKLEPHDCRRSAGGWLRDLGLSDLALGQYNPTRGEAIGYTGVGWENSEIYFQRYGKMNPKAIYEKKLRLDPTIFTGLVHKILENRANK